MFFNYKYITDTLIFQVPKLVYFFKFKMAFKVKKMLNI